MHEMDHKLRLGGTYRGRRGDNLMSGYRTVGDRRIPADGQAVHPTTSANAAVHFLTLRSERFERDNLRLGPEGVNPLTAIVAGVMAERALPVYPARTVKSVFAGLA